MQKKPIPNLFLKDNGFTLVEVMIAITILAFIMLSVVTVTDSSQTTKERVISEDREFLQVETAMARLEWDISQTYSPLYFSHSMEPVGLTQQEGDAYNQMVDKYSRNERFGFLSYDGLPVPIFRYPDKSTISFLTLSNRRKFKNIKQSHFAWVQYSLESPDNVAPPGDEVVNTEEEPKGSVLVRRFTADNIFSPDPVEWDKIKAQVLLRNVEKLGFEYWNPETKKWEDNPDLIKDGAHLIRGLRMTIEWIDPDQITQKIIRVFRPLFPQFKAENMYKLQQQANGTLNNNNNNSGNNNNGTNSNGQ